MRFQYFVESGGLKFFVCSLTIVNFSDSFANTRNVSLNTTESRVGLIACIAIAAKAFREAV